MVKIIYNIIIIFFVFFGGVVFAQETGKIYGIITDAKTGEAIPNAEVMISNTSDGTVSLQNGYYEFTDLNPGIYTLKVHALGYTSGTRSGINVMAGKNTEINFKLHVDDILLGEITISASKTGKTVKATGTPIYLVEKSRIEMTNRRNIGEALIEIPGIFIEDAQHSEASVISFRGIGLHTYVTRGILVLVDGIPITEAMGRTNFEGIDMQNVEKIEVLKGPVSALYGPNGLSGVINVIERSPEDGIHGDFELLLGSYGTGKLSANINGGKDGFNYMVRANHYKSEGYRDHSAYKSTHLGLKFSKIFKKAGKFRFTIDYSLSDSELAGSLDSVTFVENPTASDRKFAGYDKKLYRAYFDYIKNLGDNSTLTANIYSRGRYDEGHYSDRTWGKYAINLFGGEVRYMNIFDLFDQKNKITFGAKFDRESSDIEEYKRDEQTGAIGNLSNKGEVIYDMAGFYAENEFNLNNKLFLTIGLRYDLIYYDWRDKFNDNNENTSAKQTLNALSPKFGFGYNPTRYLTIFGNIGKGFNPPQYSELFIGSRTAAPNPYLKPEYLTNYEIGLRGILAKKVNYQVSCYLMNFVDQISSAPDPNNPGEEIYANVGDTQHEGIELAVNYSVINSLNAYVSYSYLKAKFTNSPDDDLIGNELRNAPNHQYSLGLRYHMNFGLSVSADFKYVGEYKMDNEDMFTYEGYKLLNAKMIYRLKGFSVSVAINNILDLKYAARAYAANYRGWRQYYSPAWPRNYSFTIGYSF